MQPISTKLYNSKHESDYYTGFTPDFAVTEGTKLYPYCNPKTPLLGEALFHILGERVTRRALRETEVPQEISTTITVKPGGSNMFLIND